MRTIESLLPVSARPFRMSNLGVWACVVMATACGGGSKSAPNGNDNDSGTGNEEAFTGTYTVRGDTFECEVSSQDFPATGEYSIVCQNDDDGLVQITFKNEDSARTPQSFTITERDILEHPDATTVDVSYMPFGDGGFVYSRDDSTGTAVVTAGASNDVLTLTDVSMGRVDEEDTFTASAVINF